MSDNIDKLPEEIKPELVPHTQAETAFDLLNDIIRIIQEEPRRMDMGNWICNPKAVSAVRKLPACGTVGCIAGWAVVLHDGVEPAYRGQRYIAERAVVLLTGALNQTGTLDLFDGDVFEYYDDEEGFRDYRVLNPGDANYVSLVIRRIEEYRDQHELHLKSIRLADLPSFDGTVREIHEINSRPDGYNW